MAYVTITAGQVDADSPLDATLMGQIKANFDAHEVEKLERDGTIPMTGMLDMDGNSITMGGGLLDTEAGDIDMGGGDLDTEGGDGTFQDVTVNGNLIGPDFAVSTVTWSLAGTTQTVAAGTIFDNIKTIDFTTHLTAEVHWAWAPDVDPYFCRQVVTITDVNNIVTNVTNNYAGVLRDYGTGNAYNLVENGDWIIKKTTTGTPVFWNDTVSDTEGGLNRSWIQVDLTYQAGASRTISCIYGGNTTVVHVGNSTTNAIFYLKMKTGDNTLEINSGGIAVNSSTVTVSVDHISRFSSTQA